MVNVRQIIGGDSYHTGRYRAFDSDERLKALEQPIVVTGAPFTIMCWFFQTADPSQSTDMWGQQNAGGQHEWGLQVDGSSNALEFFVQAGGSLENATSSTTVTQGQWNHACGLEISSSNHRVYLNGAGEGINTDTAAPTLTGMECRIGGVKDFEGDLAWVTVWDTALTLTEIQDGARGKNPMLIRPQHIISCVPCVGITPEPDIAPRAGNKTWDFSGGVDMVSARALPQLQKYDDRLIIPAVSGVTGTSAMTMLLPTMAATGVAARAATSAMTMLLPTMTASGKLGHFATSAMNIPLPGMIDQAEGNVAHQGTSALTMLLPTMAATGVAAHVATSAMTMLIPTMVADGTINAKIGTSAMTMLLPTMAATGKLTYFGTSAMTMLLPTMAAAGKLTYFATSAMTMLLPTMAATGVAAHQATSAMTMLLPTMAATGKLTYFATSAMTMLIPTMTASGVVSAGITGTSAMTMLLPTMAATGFVAHAATSAMTMLLPTMVASGKLTYFATSAMTMLLPTMAASGKLTHFGTSAMAMLVPTMVASGVAAHIGTSAMAMLIPTMTASGTVGDVAVVVCTDGVWSSTISFLPCDDFRITIDGPAADQVKVSATMELEE